jgi:hypothetical protein
LSYRDFLTSFSLALFLAAIRTILIYYSDEKSLENIWSSIVLMIFFLFILINHIIYKAEHKRSNNFIGRIFHTAIFILAFWIVITLYNYFLDDAYLTGLSVDIGSIVIFIIVVPVLLMLLELTITILKRVLNLFNWRIL